MTKCAILTQHEVTDIKSCLGGMRYVLNSMPESYTASEMLRLIEQIEEIILDDYERKIVVRPWSKGE